jgi:hypothetical protein
MAILGPAITAWRVFCRTTETGSMISQFFQGNYLRSFAKLLALNRIISRYVGTCSFRASE